MKNIMPIILILASAALFFGYINPTYTGDTHSAVTADKSVTELQSEEADYADALNKTADIERARNILAAKLNAIDKTNITKIGKLLPDHIDSVRLIIDINNIAAKYGMSLTNIVLTASGIVPNAKAATGAATAPVAAPVSAATGFGPDERQYDSIKLGFAVTGAYDSFVQFLKEIEESLRIVDVTSLSFGSNAVKPSSVAGSSAPTSPAVSDFYTYTMTIRTYYLK